MKLFLLSLCGVLFFNASYAQRNYVPATIVNRQNDSVKGFVDYRAWTITPREIRFKESLSAESERVLGPGEIRGFTIANPDETYISGRLAMDITNLSLENLSGNTIRAFQDTLIFLRLVTKGEYNLYEYADRNKRSHFAFAPAGNTSALVELQYTKAYIERLSGLAEDTHYQEQLETLFADCPNVARRAAKSSYNEQELTKRFNDYNACKHPAEAASMTAKTKQKGGVRFGIIGGVSMNSFKTHGALYTFSDRNEFSSSISPLFGAFIDIALIRDRRQLSLVNEIVYKSVKTDGIIHSSVSMDDGATLKYNFSYLGLNTLFRYTYPKGLVKPFVDMGVSVAYMTSKKENELHRKSGVTTEAIQGPRSHELGFLTGAGVEIKNFDVELRLALGDGFSPYQLGKIGVTSLQLLAKYHF